MKKNKIHKFESAELKSKFDLFSPIHKKKLLFLRQLIFDTASQLKEIEKLTETLKWNEPSYVSSKPKVGSPIRINTIKNSDEYAIFFNCSTSLISTFKQIYPDTFNYRGSRAIIFNINEKIPVKELTHCISLALTYHLNKKSMSL